MRVVHYPFGTANPYMRLLTEALERQRPGLETVPYTHRRFFAYGSSPLVSSSTGLVHLHMTGAGGKTKLLTRVNGALYLHNTKRVRRAGVPIVWTIHDLVSHESSDREHETKVLRRFLNEVPDRMIVHGEAGKREVCALYGDERADDIDVIPHGNYDGEYPPMPARDEARARFDLPRDGTVFLMFGMIRANKGAGALLEAFASLPVDAAAHLVIAGRPFPHPEVQRVIERARVAERVTLIDRRIEDDEVSALFGACDVAVLPYASGLTSGVVILAQTLGRACIAPSFGCIGEAVAPDAGIVFDASDPDALGRSLLEAVRDPGALGAMGGAGRAKAAQADWDTVARMTLETYDRAVEHAKNRR